AGPPAQARPARGRHNERPVRLHDGPGRGPHRTGVDLPARPVSYASLREPAALFALVRSNLSGGRAVVAGDPGAPPAPALAGMAGPSGRRRRLRVLLPGLRHPQPRALGDRALRRPRRRADAAALAHPDLHPDRPGPPADPPGPGP